MTAVVALFVIVCVLVLTETGVLFVHLTGFRRLARVPNPEPAAWPRVSVVITARSQARDVAAAVTSWLSDDYPCLEIILIDDRSDDGTGRIALDAAGGDRRFALVRVDKLPAGWLGKVHALHCGEQRATGQWLLFSDGDAAIRPGTLRRAVSHCLNEKLGMLALVPAFGADSAMVDAIWTTFLRGLLVMVDPRAVRDPRSRVAMGSGGFNLVRRDALDCSPGLGHLRMETADDVALGLMLKRAGGRVELMNGSGHVSVPMYRSVGEFLRGIEKNGSTMAALPLPVLVGALALLWTVVLAPVGALVAGPAWLHLLGAVALSAYTAGDVAALWTNSRRWWPALLWPVGGLLMSYGLIRAAWLARRNGGIHWRGTFYTLAELTEGRKVSL